MLVINRKRDEEIIIGDEIVIKILASSDGRVKVGIDAPSGLTVHRMELYKRLKRNIMTASDRENMLNKSTHRATTGSDRDSIGETHEA